MKEAINNLPEDERLNLLVADYYNQAGKGCSHSVLEIVTGKTQRRMKQISEILGISDRDVATLFMSINYMSLGPTKEETLRLAQEALMKGTHGGQTTGSLEGDIKIINIASFIRTVIDKRWELKEKQPNTKIS
ncbi:MAG: hypothetical protein WCV81_05830 [Microgenomates group bacterium]|jgi:hypothetical protein